MKKNHKPLRLCAVVLMFVVSLTVLFGCEQMAINVAKNSWSKPYEEQIEANQAYLFKYPDGEYAKEARERLDINYIKIARRDEMIEDYQNYLAQFPDGKYTDEALAALASLGQAFPEAPAYDPKANDPFKINHREIPRRKKHKQ